MGTPAISIIVPIYNTAEYLAACVDSLIAQTCTDLQIILVNDGSTDESGKICDEYAARDARITVLHKENGGNTCARKAGLQLATGDYVQFVDSDDWIEPDMCEKLLSLATENDVDLVRCRFYNEIGRTPTAIGDKLPAGIYRTAKQMSELRAGMIYMPSGECNFLGSIWPQLTKRKLMLDTIEKIPNELQFAEDQAMVYFCLLRAKSVCVTASIGYHYRQRAGSIMHKGNPRYFSQVNLWFLTVDRELAQHPDGEALREQLLHRMEDKLLQGINGAFRYGTSVRVPDFYFKMNTLQPGTRIALYGAGAVGQSFHRLISLTEAYPVACWVDKNPEPYLPFGYDVKPVETLANGGYDKILVAVLNEKTAEAIRKELVARFGIASSDIVWLKPFRVTLA